MAAVSCNHWLKCNVSREQAFSCDSTLTVELLQKASRCFRAHVYDWKHAYPRQLAEINEGSWGQVAIQRWRFSSEQTDCAIICSPDSMLERHQRYTNPAGWRIPPRPFRLTCYKCESWLTALFCHIAPRKLQVWVVRFCRFSGVWFMGLMTGLVWPWPI